MTTEQPTPDPVAEARDAYYELRANRWEDVILQPVSERPTQEAVDHAWDEVESAIEARTIARYLAGCAAPGCGHDANLHEDTLSHGSRNDHAFNCGCSAYLPRSELLARAQVYREALVDVQQGAPGHSLYQSAVKWMQERARAALAPVVEGRDG